MKRFGLKLRTPAKKLCVRVIGVTVVVACVTAMPAFAQESAPKKTAASKQENIGVATGFAVGAAAGGPVGAVVGAAAGAWLGDRYHKQAVAHKALAADLNKSETDRAHLAQSVTELNGSLARSQEHGEQADLALTRTNEIGTDVGFRTNDASIQDQALPPLLKLGALAAAMPGAKVRVEGYADPRGSDSVNDALSRRRAEAVASVLATAGLPADQMIVEAHGKSTSTSADGDLDAYAFDRRVTVRIERHEAAPLARNE